MEKELKIAATKKAIELYNRIAYVTNSETDTKDIADVITTLQEVIYAYENKIKSLQCSKSVERL